MFVDRGKDMNTLISKYNQPDTIVMISPYPNKGELYSSGVSGIASYTKNIVSSLQKKVIVLADNQKKSAIYEENNVLVIRCFKKHSPFMWLQILKTLLALNFPTTIQVQFDFALYGNMAISSFVLPFLLIVRLMGKKTSLVTHSVILNIFELSGHIGLGNSLFDSIKGRCLNVLFHLFYQVLGIATDSIVTTEETLAIKLRTLLPKSQIVAIPHGVDTNLKPISKNIAREKLGLSKQDYVVMFFGYVNWFKGADFFAQAFKNEHKILGKNTHFILAGGVSPTMKGKTHYDHYFAKTTQTICDSPVMNMTGYIAQEDIELYFSAADLVVFPYRTFMAASGVMSLVLSYEKPFIVSENIKEMFDAPDFKEAFKQVHLSAADISFALTEKSAQDAAEKVLKNGLKKKMVEASKIMRNVRSYKNTAKQYEMILANSSLNLYKPLTFSYN